MVYKNQRSSDSTDTKSSSLATKLRSETSAVCGQSDSDSVIEKFGEPPSAKGAMRQTGSLGIVQEKAIKRRETSLAIGSENSTTPIPR